MGCKRPSISNKYFRTFTRDDVALVTDPIERITPTGIVTADGTAHDIDVLICATGFKVMTKGSTPPYPWVGTSGEDIGDFWERERYQAYQGVSAPKYPNSFLLIGPYAYSPTSYLVLLEATVDHAVRAISEARKRGATRLEIKQAPHDRYWQRMLRRADRTPLLKPSCAGSNTYYVNHQGDAVFRPTSAIEMRRQNRHYPIDDYAFTVARGRNGGREIL